MTARQRSPFSFRRTREAPTPADKAYRRRSRRHDAVSGRLVNGRLTRTGSPIAAALSRVPFVAAVLLVLAGGIVGVLWLNTVSDATGLQATASRLRQEALDTQIQALSKDVNTLGDPARLAGQAAALGLVPAGDAAMLQIGSDGRATVIGTPTPVAAGVAPAVGPTAPATTTAATTPATTTPAMTPLGTTTPATRTPATTTPATNTKMRAAQASTAVTTTGHVGTKATASTGRAAPGVVTRGSAQDRSTATTSTSKATTLASAARPTTPTTAAAPATTRTTAATATRTTP